MRSVNAHFRRIRSMSASVGVPFKVSNSENRLARRSTMFFITKPFLQFPVESYQFAQLGREEMMELTDADVIARRSANLVLRLDAILNRSNGPP